MIESFVAIFLLFIFYSMLGYLLEITIFSIEEKKFVNRGFLFGPYCPVYGFGSLFITYFLTGYRYDPLIVFVFGVIVTSIVEYITSYLLEKIFHNRWWDYSNHKFHINGRVWLVNSLRFGLGACFVIYFFNPFLKNIFTYINFQFALILSVIILVLFIVDIIASFIIAFKLRNYLIVVEELKKYKLKMIPEFFERTFRKRLLRSTNSVNHFLKAFPNLSKLNESEIAIIKKWHNKTKPKKKRQTK